MFSGVNKGINLPNYFFTKPNIPDMKILKASMLLLAFIVLTSCSKDDDTPDPGVEQLQGIAGEWQLEEYYYTRTSTVSTEDSTFSSSYDAVATDLDVKFKIDTESNIWSINGNYVLRLNIIEEGETVTREIVVKDLADTGSFNYDGYWFDPVQHAVGFPGFPEPGEINLMNYSTFIIEDLTADRLELTISEAISFREDEMPAVITRKGTQVYKRL